MSASRTLCSRTLCPLGTAVARRRGPVVSFAPIPEPPAPSTRRRLQSSAAPVEDTGLREETTDPGHNHSTRPPPRPRARTAFTGPSEIRTRPKSVAANQSALALFNEVIHGNPGTDFPESNDSPGDVTIQGLEVLARVKDLRFSGNPPAVIFQKLYDDLWTDIQALGHPLPAQLYRELNQILKITCKSISLQDRLETPFGLAMSRMHDTMGKVDLDMRLAAILITCLAITNENDPTLRESLARDVVACWKSYSQMMRTTQRDQPLQFTLPEPSHVKRLVRKARHMDLGDATEETYGYMAKRYDFNSRAICAMFNQFSTGQAQKLIPGLLVTLAVFSDPNLVTPEVFAELAPLLDLSHAVIPECIIDDTFIDSIFATTREDLVGNKKPQLVKLLRDRWHMAAEVMETPEYWRKGDARPTAALPAMEATSSLVHIHKQLRAAHATDNRGAVVSIWRKLRESQADDPVRTDEMRGDPEFMDFWHFVWCAQRRPDLLHETQEVMQDIGLEPTIKTFTAMMHGWKLSKDAAKIDTMWKTLMESGIELDTHAWTERVSSLIEHGSVQKGIETLAEMMAKWKTAVERGQPETAVQPTIEVINAAFKPLIRSDRRTANEVLKWAAQQGIQPDVMTYNILLRECFRLAGEGKETEDDVQDLLRTMRAQGIEPDAATFTILIDEALSGLGNATPDEHVTAINNIMEDIKAADVSPNLQTYGKMLHAVVSLPSASRKTIDSVLSHMRSTGHRQISPHMVLILINRYLDGREGRPRPGGIRRILKRHGFTSIHTGDQRLWEHVVSAYATLGDKRSALELYDELRRAGRPITRQFALRDLLVALIESEDWDAARDVVRNALVDVVEENMSERTWRHHFWHSAHKYGLLNWDDAPPGLRKVVDEQQFPKV